MLCLCHSRLKATLQLWTSSLIKHSSTTNPDTRVCPKKKRKFTPLPYSYKYIMEYLIKKMLLQLIDPIPPPYSLPYCYNQVEHCEYHQTLRHTLDRYFHLKHDIRDLINEGKVSLDPTPTNPPSNSNIIQNPLPDHKPPKWVNMIGITSTQFNPTSYITKISKPKKVIFFPDTDHMSTINGYSPELIPPPKYKHLLQTCGIRPQITQS